MDAPNYLIGETIRGYKVIEVLGKGGFAYVYRAKPRTGHDVALKVINKGLIKNEELKKRVEKEAEIHSSLNHESIIKLYEFFKEGNCVFLVLELCERGTLTQYLEERRYPFSESEAREMLRQVADGVEYLHFNNIMHRDLSPRNLLLTRNGKVKIADFGLAADTEDKHKTLCGTPNFMSPEVATRSLYGPEVDVWSLGCLLFHLLVGKPPFDANGIKRTLTNVVRDECKVPSSLSAEAKDLIQLMLKKDAKCRIKLQAIKDHRFMNVSIYSSKSVTKGGSSLESGLGSSFASSSSGRRRSPANRLQADSALELDTIQSTGLSDYYSNAGTHQHCGSALVHKHHQNSFKSPPVKHKSWENIPSSQNPIGLLKTKLPSLPSFGVQLNELRTRQRSPVSCEPVHRGRERDVSEERRKQNSTNSRRSAHYEEDMKSFHDLFEKIADGKKTSSDCCLAHHNSSCSHHQMCCSDREQCSHPELCQCRGCRKHCSVECVSYPKESGCCHHPKSPQNVASVASHSGRRSPSPVAVTTRTNSLRNHTEPLDTSRLRPTRQRTRNAIVSILENGEVCVEFLKKIKQVEKVVDVCRISEDGLRIIIYRPGCRGVPVKNNPPPVPKDGADDIFSFESFPEKHWKKYEYAARFVQLVRAKTPRLTFYSSRAKCIMMENLPDPDFEVCFYSGGKIVKSASNAKSCSPKSQYKIIDVASKPVVINGAEDVQKLRPHVQDMWQHFLEVEEHCKVLDQALTKVGNSSGKPCFPAIIGRRPNNAALNPSESNKENVVPSTVRSSVNTPLSHSIMSFNGTLNTEQYLSDGSSPNTELLSDRSFSRQNSRLNGLSEHRQVIMHSERKESVTKNLPSSVFVVGVGLLSQSMNGVTIRYIDHSELHVPASSTGQIVYTDTMGEVTKYGQHSSIPKDVEEKLSQVESIVHQLYRTSSCEMQKCT